MPDPPITLLTATADGGMMALTRRIATIALSVLLPLGTSPLRIVDAVGDNPRPIVKHPDPVYPELAHQMHLGGVVVLAVTVEPDGHVSDAHAVSGHPILIRAAEDAVRQWKFATAPESSQSTVKITFVPR